MKKTRPIKPSSILFWLAIMVLLTVIGVVVRRPQSLDRRVEKTAGDQTVTNVFSTAGRSANAPTTLLQGSPATTNSSGFQLRPFSVVKETATHQWTTENGRDTNVIRRLAHNNLEYQRMVEENNRIQRRQLVYRKDTAAAVMQRARASGESVKQLTLPGFDGQELQVAINRADLEPSWQSGTFTGRLADKPNSMVTVAFKFGRESFTVLSPDDGTYLQAWPREPGELIVTSFDPDVYQAMPEGEPIRTTNTFKIAQ